MIVDLIVGVVLGVFNSIFALFPEMVITTDYGAVPLVMKSLNVFFPITEIIVCVAIIIGVRLGFGLWHLVEWVWAHVPFKAT